MAELAAMTDIPFADPLQAVEAWNLADHRDFPQTDAMTSVHPVGITLADGQFVRDAYAAVFSVQPSTRGRLSATDQPLYVAPNGTLLGTIDYRVVIPENTSSVDRRVEWTLKRHAINATRLLVDGAVESRSSGSNTPRLSYTELAEYTGSTHTLALEADVAVALEQTVSECTAWTNASTVNSTSNTTVSTTNSQSGPTSRACTNWEVTVTEHAESLTVRDAVEVTVYTLSVSGFQTRYPDGDLGVVVYKNQPWLGYEAPTGSVRGSWRFYSARETGWDTLAETSSSGSTLRHSPLHPLQVTAFPMETGPTPAPRANVSLIESFGVNTTAPTLPPNVQLDVPEDSYTASYGLASRLHAANYSLSRLSALGLVRGVETSLRPESFSEIPFHRSNLSLDVLNASAETTTVRVSLRDRETGDPIETQSREGYVLVDGQRINTTANGTALVTLAGDRTSVSARYEPERWWDVNPAYTGDSTIVYTGGSTLQVLSVLYQTSIPIGLFLVAVFLIDRITGWDIWPPWGRV
ncbi:hypothetical protein [Salinibaculum marinum]